MQIQTIRTVLLLCEIPSMSKCSKQLHISQQGLSSQIKSLEQELGVTLFHRDNKGVTPTKACELLLPFFQNIINQYDAGMASLEQHLKDQPEVLNIWVCPCIREIYNLGFFMRFQKDHPNIQLNLKFRSDVECEEALLSGKADGAFLDWPIHEKQYQKHLVIRSPMVAVVRDDHVFANRQSISVQELSGHHITIPNENHRMHQRFRDNMPNIYNSVTIALSSDDAETFYQLPKTFGGIAVPFKALCKNLDPCLRMIPFQEEINIELSYCVLKNKSSSHALRIFSDYIYNNMEIIDDTGREN